jgi:hypothetical protein
MRLPERITYKWMGTLDDDALLTAEARLQVAFAAEEKAHRHVVGDRYELMRGPAELLGAWDRWSRVNTETRSRNLNPRRPAKGR